MSPVVVILGTRQTGKTTFVRSKPGLADRPYVALDDVEARARFASRDQAGGGCGEAPHAGPVRAHGFRQSAPDGKGLRVARGLPSLYTAAAIHAMRTRAAARSGGLPVPAHELKSDDERALWFSGYVQTYLERDLQDLRAVQDLADFRRLMRAACLRLGNLINQTELGRDMGMSQPQVHRYLNLLETSYQAVRIPAYGVNRTRRLIKTPKLYWSDPGLAMFLAGETEPRGAHLENLVLLDLIVWRDCQARRPEIHYWRTASGLEVDFIVESGNRLLPIEVKSGHLESNAANALEAFLDDHGDKADGGLILYDGTEIMRFSKRVIAVPWWSVC